MSSYLIIDVLDQDGNLVFITCTRVGNEQAHFHRMFNTQGALRGLREQDLTIRPRNQAFATLSACRTAVNYAVQAAREAGEHPLNKSHGKRWSAVRRAQFVPPCKVPYNKGKRRKPTEVAKHKQTVYEKSSTVVQCVETGKLFAHAALAAAWLGVKSPVMYAHLAGRKKSVGGYTWTKVNKSTLTEQQLLSVFTHTDVRLDKNFGHHANKDARPSPVSWTVDGQVFSGTARLWTSTPGHVYVVVFTNIKTGVAYVYGNAAPAGAWSTFTRSVGYDKTARYTADAQLVASDSGSATRDAVRRKEMELLAVGVNVYKSVRRKPSARDDTVARKASIARQHGRVVLCVETGDVYFSVGAAAYAVRLTHSAVLRAIKTCATAAGVHWRTVNMKDLPENTQCAVNKAIAVYVATGEYVYPRRERSVVDYAAHGLSTETLRKLRDLLVDDAVKQQLDAGELRLTDVVRVHCAHCGKVLYKTIANHLRTSICKSCATRSRYTAIRAANAKHEVAELIVDERHRLRYMTGQYNDTTRVAVQCPVCGEQRMMKLKDLVKTQRSVCQRCVTGQLAHARRQPNPSVLAALVKQEDRQAYVDGELGDRTRPAVFACACGGTFTATVHQFLYDGKTRCAKCVRHFVGEERAIVKQLRKTMPPMKIRLNARDVLQPGETYRQELDIYVPSARVGIEYNGLFWHKVTNTRDAHYHRRKFLLAEEVNVRLVNVFEHVWRDDPWWCMSMLRGVIAPMAFDHVDVQFTCTDGELVVHGEVAATCNVVDNVMTVNILHGEYGGDRLLGVLVDRWTRLHGQHPAVYVDHDWLSGERLLAQGWTRVDWVDKGCWFYGKNVYTDWVDVPVDMRAKVMRVNFVGVGVWQYTG